jgi:hypothetical protein
MISINGQSINYGHENGDEMDDENSRIGSLDPVEPNDIIRPANAPNIEANHKINGGRGRGYRGDRRNRRCMEERVGRDRTIGGRGENLIGNQTSFMPIGPKMGTL